MPRKTAHQRAKDARNEVVGLVLDALKLKYDALKEPHERQAVTATDSTLRVRFQEFSDNAPVYVRVKIVGEA